MSFEVRPTVLTHTYTDDVGPASQGINSAVTGELVGGAQGMYGVDGWSWKIHVHGDQSHLIMARLSLLSFSVKLTSSSNRVQVGIFA